MNARARFMPMVGDSMLPTIEGAPSETFVDDDSRGMFHNAAEWRTAHPGQERVPAVFCAPRVESGPELEAIRRRLDGVAARSPRRLELRRSVATPR